MLPSFHTHSICWYVKEIFSMSLLVAGILNPVVSLFASPKAHWMSVTRAPFKTTE